MRCASYDGNVLDGSNRCVRRTDYGRTFMAVAVVRKQTSVVSPLYRRGVVQADLSCLMCGRMVGQVVDGRIVHHSGCGGQLRVERGMLRCCGCGGSVYREPVSSLTAR